ncbi:MAG: outer membrane protein transport protein [Marinobacter sp.]|nr:outer membrane protein transport protein [Marinobacter sp.]
MRTLRSTLAPAVLLALATPAMAGMGTTATTYGLLPFDVSTAQSLSLFGTQASAAYYNPAALTRDPRMEITGAIFHAEHDLKARSVGGSDPLSRSSNTLSNTPSQQLQLGLKFDLAKLTQYDHPVYLGLMVGTEKYAQDLLAFRAETSQGGQYLQYGRQPLFASGAIATRLWRGVHVGGGVRIMLENDANLYVTTDLQGNTDFERLTVSARPVVTPVVGARVQMGDTFCERQNCWLDGLELAVAYRGQVKAEVKVGAEAEIDGVINNPGLPLAISAIDGFQPATVSVGALYELGGYSRVGVTVELQQWSALDDELAKDTVRDQANARFRDIVIPRLGYERDLTHGLTMRGGVSWEPSSLKDNDTLEVNYLDTDRIVIGLGGSLVWRHPPVLAFPLQLDFGYQYHHLIKRDFDLYSAHPSNPSGPNQPFETVEASGSVHVFTGSATLRF